MPHKFGLDSPQSVKYISRKAFFKHALDKSVEFIQAYNVKEPDRMDYINYVTGFFVYYPDPSDDKIKKLVDWYNKVDFNNKSNSRRRDIFTRLLNM